MNLQEISACDIIAGKRKLPDGKFQIVDYESTGRSSIKRITLEDDEGNTIVIMSSTYSRLELFEPKQVEMVDRVRVISTFKETGNRVHQIFEDRYKADAYVGTFDADKWTHAVEDVKIPENEAHTSKPKDDIPF